ncbi:MAG: hypothetical protein WBW78_14435, partial [Terrimicrobiaceae bacterium]
MLIQSWLVSCHKPVIDECLTSDSVIFGYHARPRVIRTFIARKGLLALIRRTGCPEANSNVKREMGIFGDGGDPLQKQILP